MHFSVIIPTCNRPDRLQRCLNSLAKLDFPKHEFEVVVVDDGSKKALDSVVDEFHDQLKLTLLRTTNQGPSAARNTGSEVATGKFLAFTDDDCDPDPDWLSRLQDGLGNSEECMAGGRTVNRLRKNCFSMASQFIVDIAYAFYNRNPKNAAFFASNNMALSARLYKKVGGFDSKFRIASEDRELCDRCRFMGYRLIYLPQAMILHSHRLSFFRFWRQHFRYGRGAARYHRVRALRGSGRLFHDLLFHCCLPKLLIKQFYQLKLLDAIALIPILMFWQIANAMGFVYENLFGQRTV